MIIAAALAASLALAPQLDIDCDIVDEQLVCSEWPEDLPFPFPKPPTPAPPLEPVPTRDPVPSAPDPEPVPAPARPPAPKPPAPAPAPAPATPPRVVVEQPTLAPKPTPTPTPTPDPVTFAPRPPVEPRPPEERMEPVEPASVPAPEASLWGVAFWTFATLGVALLAVGVWAIAHSRVPQHAGSSGRHRGSVERRRR